MKTQPLPCHTLPVLGLGAAPSPCLPIRSLPAWGWGQGLLVPVIRGDGDLPCLAASGRLQSWASGSSPTHCQALG